LHKCLTDSQRQFSLLPERGNECLTALHGPQAVACAMREFVPDHQNLASDLPNQRVKKFNQLLSLDRPRIQSEIEVLKGDASDRRQMVPIEMILQDRGVPAGCPTTNPSRSFAQSRLVDEDDGSPLFSSVFLTPASARASSAGSLPRRARVHEWSAAGC